MARQIILAGQHETVHLCGQSREETLVRPSEDAEDADFRNEDRYRPGIKKEYGDERVAVSWEPALCIHVGACLRGLPDVFDAERRPWIMVDNTSPDEIAEVVMRCPTGALHFRRLDDGEPEPELDETTVTERPNGPLYVRGRVRVVGQDGRLLREDTRVALCRCGQSQNKPFCDGSHRKVGFRTTRPARTRPGSSTKR